jgi:hypothetical protein
MLKRFSTRAFNYTKCQFPHVYFAVTGNTCKIGYSNVLSIAQQVSKHKNADIVIFRHNNPKQMSDFLKKKYTCFKINTNRPLFISCVFDDASMCCRLNGGVYSYPLPPQ